MNPVQGSAHLVQNTVVRGDAVYGVVVGPDWEDLKPRTHIGESYSIRRHLAKPGEWCFCSSLQTNRYLFLGLVKSGDFCAAPQGCVLCRQPGESGR